MGGERSSGLACSSCCLLGSRMSLTAAWLQSTNTPTCGSSNQMASALRSKRLSNTVPVCLSDSSGALVLSSQWRFVVDEFMVCGEAVYSTSDELHQHLETRRPRLAARLAKRFIRIKLGF